jgi:lysophospholipase L1-like esterase
VGVAVAATVAALLLAEVGARILLPRSSRLRLEQFTDIVSERHRIDFADVFVDDDETIWRLAPDVRLADDAWPLPGLISNRQGVREDHEIEEAKPEREVRILFLGDSSTFGYGLAFDETYVEQTERLLASAVSSQDVECINAGVPGYTLFQGWRWLETRGFDLQPDLVVLSFGWNEIAEWDGISDLQHYEEVLASRPPGPLAASRLARLLWQASGNGDRPSAAGRRPRLVPHEFRQILERVDQSCRRRGVDWLLLVWPSTENLDRQRPTPLQEEQYRFAAEHAFGPRGGPALVDGVEAMRAMARRHPVSDLYQDPIHPTALANRGVAEAVARAIVPWLRERSSN